jgi:hypothetical protein
MMTRASKRGRALSGKPFVSHRADRGYASTPSTVLSVLAGAHSVGAGILGFFDTKAARALRLVCTEFREAVAVVPWADTGTRISRNAGGWRTCFPRATKHEDSQPAPQFHNLIVDADFVHFEGLHTLDMSLCSQAGITDAAFVHLKGIHKLICQTTTRRASRTPHLSTSMGFTHSTRNAQLQPGEHHPTTPRPPPCGRSESPNVTTHAAPMARLHFQTVCSWRV